MHYGYEDTRDYWFVLCDKDCNTVASDLPYYVEGVKAAKTDAVDWIERFRQEM